MGQLYHLLFDKDEEEGEQDEEEEEVERNFNAGQESPTLTGCWMVPVE